MQKIKEKIVIYNPSPLLYNKIKLKYAPSGAKTEVCYEKI